ncbi:MAG: ATP-binding protein [Bradyrhizobium sp.]|uniref:sensor histidine kinase n=1 Tax=Bradyrhizobium sp. TaxID=376 RepID=UPI001224AEAE|nr:ATP-binding protein [Bradyrhizobium sp.]THD59237.1 MAG: ATP-binding protein [Bradyrhizobium sp.]
MRKTFLTILVASDDQDAASGRASRRGGSRYVAERFGGVGLHCGQRDAACAEEAQRETSQLLRVDEIISEICRDLASMKASVTIFKMDVVKISSAPLALTRAIRNLAINAVTHGGGAFVTVGLEDRTALITIDDEGPGIPEQSMSRVFEPFFQVDPARRKSMPGAGLGLAIAKEIVERHGGKLTLQNRSARALRQEIVFPALLDGHSTAQGVRAGGAARASS